MGHCRLIPAYQKTGRAHKPHLPAGDALGNWKMLPGNSRPGISRPGACCRQFPGRNNQCALKKESGTSRLSGSRTSPTSARHSGEMTRSTGAKGMPPETLMEQEFAVAVSPEKSHSGSADSTKNSIGG